MTYISIPSLSVLMMYNRVSNMLITRLFYYSWLFLTLAMPISQASERHIKPRSRVEQAYQTIEGLSEKDYSPSISINLQTTTLT